MKGEGQPIKDSVLSMNEPYLKNPERYAWNLLLTQVQFTQEELLHVRNWIVIRSLIRYQTSVTKAFLEEHFATDIDESLEVDWAFVELYVHK